MVSQPGPTLAAPMLGPEAWRRTLEAKQQFLQSDDPGRPPPAATAVRHEILQSWRRSLLSGVDATSRDLPRDEGATPPGRLVHAAQPILDRLADQLAGMRVWAFLTDRDCRLITTVVGDPALVPELEARGALPGARFGEDVVGTNGLGTAVEQQQPFIVAGSEHFREHESRATTAGAPVRDPMTRRLVGVLNANCRYELTNGLLLPFITELAAAIEARLRAAWSADEQSLFEEFTRQSRRCSQPVVALSEEVVVANTAARRLLDTGDHELLRQWACDAVSDGRERTVELRLRPDLTVLARCRPVRQASRRAAAVVVMTPAPATGVPPPAARRQARSSAWERLLRQLAHARAARLPVLLWGERGTGKTVLARSLHGQAGASGPLTVLDATTSQAQLQDWVARLGTALADPTATVVLRHLDGLAPSLVGPTASLLESPAARLVATAGEHIHQSEDLATLVERLPIALDVPPLRQHTEDIPALVTETIAELRPQPPRPRCTPDALAVLVASEWPGNIRQLRQVVATALVRSMSSDVTVDDLPHDYAGAGTRRHLTKLQRLERQALVTALRDADWNREAAARDMGISRATIYRKLRSLGIHPPTMRGSAPAGKPKAHADPAATPASPTTPNPDGSTAGRIGTP